MKKMFMHLGCLILLSGGVLFSLQGTAKANVQEPSKEGVIIEAHCCKGGGRVGSSNYCGRGAGDCIPNGCPAGTTQNPSEYCTVNE